MANIFLAWQNRADEGILSGGSWLSALPLTNMQTRQVQKVARTSDVTAASTRFDIDLQRSQTLGVIALVVHNLSVDSRVRISGATELAAWTNLIPSFTNDLSNAAWTKAFCTATQVSNTAPDGTASVSQITNTTDTDPGTVTRVFTQGGTTTLTNKTYLKKGTANDASLAIEWFNGGTTQFVSASINLNTGVVTTFTSGGGTLISATSRDAGDGWWHLSVTGLGTSVGNTQARFYISNTGGIGQTLFSYDARLLAGSGPAYESPWIAPWPAGIIPQELLEWEDDNFWLGTLSAQARAGFQSPFIHRFPTAAAARYWRVEMLDTANGDGYVQIGRLFMARGWSPAVNFSYGAALGYQDPTPVETSLSGAEYFDMRSKFRVMNFQLDYITDSEAYGYALELQRLAGISGEVLVMPDGGEDVGQQPLRCFVGRLRQIGPVRQPNPTAYSVNFEAKELL